MRRNIDLIKLLQKIDHISCPKFTNFHTHTTCSDGSLSPSDLIKQANSYRIDHISITDHHSVQAYHHLNKYRGGIPGNPNYHTTLWTGIEISCLLKNCLVHVIGLDFELNSKSLTPYINGEATTGDKLQAVSVVNAIHQAGGLAILAHPARYRLGFTTLIKEAHYLGFDGGEAWYDYSMNDIWSPSKLICNDIHKQLSNLGMLSTCGTDTHGTNLLGR